MSIQQLVKMKEQLLDLKDDFLIEQTPFQKKYSIDLELANVLVVKNFTLENDDNQFIEYCVYLDGVQSAEDGCDIVSEYQDFRYFQGDALKDEDGGIAISTNIHQFVEFVFDYFYYDEFCYFGDDY